MTNATEKQDAVEMTNQFQLRKRCVPPRTPGYYYCSFKTPTFIGIAIARVFRNFNGDLRADVYTRAAVQIYNAKLDSLPGDWWGPLPEPIL